MIPESSGGQHLYASLPQNRILPIFANIGVSLVKRSSKGTKKRAAGGHAVAMGYDHRHTRDKIRPAKA